MRAQSLSHVQLRVTAWTVAPQSPLSMGLPRQEYWSGLPCPRPGDLRDPGIEPTSPALQVDSSPLSQWEAPLGCYRGACICHGFKETHSQVLSVPARLQ